MKTPFLTYLTGFFFILFLTSCGSPQKDKPVEAPVEEEILKPTVDYQALVKSHIEAEDYLEAEAAALNGLTENPNSAPLIVAMGGLEIRKGNTAKAIEYFNDAFAIEPKNISISQVLSELYTKQENPANAVRHLSIMAELLPDDLQSRIEAGNIYLKLNKPARAILLLEQAHELAPEDQGVLYLLPYAYEQLADLYSIKGNNDAAIENYSKALEKNPTLVNSYSGKVQAYLRLGQYQNAEDTIVHLISITNPSPQLYTTLGDIQLTAGKTNKARANWQKAKSLLGPNGDPRLLQKLNKQLSR